MVHRAIFNATFCCGNMLQVFESDSKTCNIVARILLVLVRVTPPPLTFNATSSRANSLINWWYTPLSSLRLTQLLVQIIRSWFLPFHLPNRPLTTEPEWFSAAVFLTHCPPYLSSSSLGSSAVSNVALKIVSFNIPLPEQSCVESCLV